jgi:hypothetical protein
MKIEIKVSLEDVKKSVVSMIRQEYGIDIDPSELKPEFSGEYDETEFVGFSAQVGSLFLGDRKKDAASLDIPETH